MPPIAQIMQLLAPSFLSGLIALVGAGLAVATVLTPYMYRGSYMERYAETLRAYDSGWGDTYRQIGDQLNSSEVVANASVFLLWALFGFAFYYLGLSVLSWFINLTTLMRQLGYRHTDKKSLVVLVAERLAVRAAGLLGLALFLGVTFNIFVPAILTVIAAAFSSPWYLGAFYVMAGIVFLAGIIHIVVVLLRIVFLKIRLISWMFEASDAR